MARSPILPLFSRTRRLPGAKITDQDATSIFANLNHPNEHNQRMSRNLEAMRTGSQPVESLTDAALHRLRRAKRERDPWWIWSRRLGLILIFAISELILILMLTTKRRIAIAIGATTCVILFLIGLVMLWRLYEFDNAGVEVKEHRVKKAEIERELAEKERSALQRRLAAEAAMRDENELQQNMKIVPERRMFAQEDNLRALSRRNRRDNVQVSSQRHASQDGNIKWNPRHEGGIRIDDAAEPISPLTVTPHASKSKYGDDLPSSMPTKSKPLPPTPPNPGIANMDLGKRSQDSSFDDLEEGGHVNIRFDRANLRGIGSVDLASSKPAPTRNRTYRGGERQHQVPNVSNSYLAAQVGSPPPSSKTAGAERSNSRRATRQRRPRHEATSTSDSSREAIPRPRASRSPDWKTASSILSKPQDSDLQQTPFSGPSSFKETRRQALPEDDTELDTSDDIARPAKQPRHEGRQAGNYDDPYFSSPTGAAPIKHVLASKSDDAELDAPDGAARPARQLRHQSRQVGRSDGPHLSSPTGPNTVENGHISKPDEQTLGEFSSLPKRDKTFGEPPHCLHSDLFQKQGSIDSSNQPPIPFGDRHQVNIPSPLAAIADDEGQRPGLPNRSAVPMLRENAHEPKPVRTYQNRSSALPPISRRQEGRLHPSSANPPRSQDQGQLHSSAGQNSSQRKFTASDNHEERLHLRPANIQPSEAGLPQAFQLVKDESTSIAEDNPSLTRCHRPFFMVRPSAPPEALTESHRHDSNTQTEPGTMPGVRKDGRALPLSSIGFPESVASTSSISEEQLEHMRQVLSYGEKDEATSYTS